MLKRKTEIKRILKRPTESSRKYFDAKAQQRATAILFAHYQRKVEGVSAIERVSRQQGIDSQVRQNMWSMQRRSFRLRKRQKEGCSESE